MAKNDENEVVSATTKVQTHKAIGAPHRPALGTAGSEMIVSMAQLRSAFKGVSANLAAHFVCDDDGNVSVGFVNDAMEYTTI